MAIEKLKNKKYRVTISNGIDPTTGKRIRISKVANSYSEARILHSELLKTVKTTLTPRRSLTDMTLNQFFAYFKENYGPQLADKTLENYECNFTRISECLGDEKLTTITPTMILNFYKKLKIWPKRNGRGGTLSSRTIQKHHTLLTVMFNKAMKWRLILTNPMDNVDPPKHTYRNTTKIPDKSEIALILKCLENESLKHRIWVLLALTSGMRRGEMFGLKWQDINFEHKFISVKRSISTAMHAVKAKEPKTPYSIRTISLPDMIFNMLSAYKRDYISHYNIIKNTSIFEGCGIFEEEYIFITETGRVGHPDSFNTFMDRFIQKYNLPKITPHTLRHASASYLINSNVDIQTVSSRLGHSSTAVTQLIYSHELKSAERESANAMAAFLENLPKP